MLTKRRESTNLVLTSRLSDETLDMTEWTDAWKTPKTWGRSDKGEVEEEEEEEKIDETENEEDDQEVDSEAEEADEDPSD